MEYIDFKCRVITPMFLAGADGKAPELRPPSIKGAMRFWWRAIMAEDNIPALKERESAIFGDTENRSKIVMQVKDQPIPEKWKIPRGEDKRGISYLLYSTRQKPSCIKEDSTFDIQISSADTDSLKHAAGSFWAVAYLGGVGSRARRGAGNIVIEDVESSLKDIDLEFEISGANSEKASEWIIGNFKKAKGIIIGDRGDGFASSYSNLSFARFVISSKPKDNWDDSLNEIGMIYKEFREEPRDDICDKAVFGLSLQYGNKKNKRYVKVQNRDINRRSSPLFFKVLRSDSKYYWLVLRLAGEFLPENVIIKTDSGQKGPDYSIIDKFWKRLIERGGREYILTKPKRLESIIERIKRDVDPKEIILFGSKARGDFHNPSDIDIAVDTERSIEEININGAVDIIDLKRADQGLKDRIYREGVVIYERKG